MNKSLIIQSEYGAEKTLIYPIELGDTVFITADYVKIRGFEIEGRIRLGCPEEPHGLSIGFSPLKIYYANHSEISENIISENICLEDGSYNNISNNKVDSIDISLRMGGFLDVVGDGGVQYPR